MKNKQKNRLVLNRSNKKDQLKQIEGISLKNLMNELICDKLKEIVNLQNVIKTDKLHYKSKLRKIYSFNEYCLPIVFLRDIHGGHLLLKDADDEQSNVAATIKNLEKSKKTAEKHFLKNSLGLLFSTGKKFLTTSKADCFKLKT